MHNPNLDHGPAPDAEYVTVTGYVGVPDHGHVTGEVTGYVYGGGWTGCCLERTTMTRRKGVVY